MGIQDNKANVAIFLQEACFRHRYIRSRDLSSIVERPERLRAISVGLAAAIARLETVFGRETPKQSTTSGETRQNGNSDPQALVAAIERLNIQQDTAALPVHLPLHIVHSRASVDILNNPAVKYIHGDIEGDVYLQKLKSWAQNSRERIQSGDSEIPEGLPQGDLYLCPESVDAIQGAIGAVCEAVDRIMQSSEIANSTRISRAFVVVRPPGHHCGEDTPSGFCFVNNVAIGAAHAHLNHGINRVVILDIDLHHGNGTQSIAWQVNEETYRQILEIEAGAPAPSKRGPQIYYGSVHDILSFPCEDGKPALVQAASVSIHKSHGQYIENVHLQEYTSEEHFWNVLYKEQYSRLLRKAEEFLDGTGGPGEDVMVFISCGMDACEHEYSSMSRHNRKVPASFYYRFTQDVCAFSDRYAHGRVVSVLEGGYSDRALTSGAMAHLSGLVDVSGAPGQVDESWWNVENLEKIEKATKKRRGGRQSNALGTQMEAWLERTVALFSILDKSPSLAQTASASFILPSDRTLRERKGNKTPTSIGAAAKEKNHKQSVKPKAGTVSVSDLTQALEATRLSNEGERGDEKEGVAAQAQKKLPRVILRLGPDPNVEGP